MELLTKIAEPGGHWDGNTENNDLFCKLVDLVASNGISFLNRVGGVWGVPGSADLRECSTYRRTLCATTQYINDAYDCYGHQRPFIQAGIFEFIDVSVDEVEISEETKLCFADYIQGTELDEPGATYSICEMTNVTPCSSTQRICRCTHTGSDAIEIFEGDFSRSCDDLDKPELDNPDVLRRDCFDVNVSSNGVSHQEIDMCSLQTQMWFFQQAHTYIDCGFQALHFGQVHTYADEEGEPECLQKVLEKIRRYTDKDLLFDYHINHDEVEFEGDFPFDFISYPVFGQEYEDEDCPDDSPILDGNLLEGIGNPNPCGGLEENDVPGIFIGQELIDLVNSYTYPPSSDCADRCIPVVLEFDHANHFCENICDFWCVAGFSQHLWANLVGDEYLSCWLETWNCFLQQNTCGVSLMMPGHMGLGWEDLDGNSLSTPWFYSICDNPQTMNTVSEIMNVNEISQEEGFNYTTECYGALAGFCSIIPPRYRQKQQHCFEVISPDCSSTYTWHIRRLNPDGSSTWLPFEVGTSFCLESGEFIEGNYEIRLRQENPAILPNGGIELLDNYFFLEEFCCIDIFNADTEEDIYVSSRNQDIEVQVYPIPFESRLNVKNYSGEAKIFDLTGRLVGKYDLTDNLPLNLDDLYSGTYILVLDNSERFKIVKI